MSKRGSTGPGSPLLTSHGGSNASSSNNAAGGGSLSSSSSAAGGGAAAAAAIAGNSASTVGVGPSASVLAAKEAALAAQAAAAATPPGPAGAKARRLAREMEERAVQAAKEDEMNVYNYNEMLKKLLSKEIAAREAQEARVAELTAAHERFRTEELEALKTSHAAALRAQADQLESRARVMADSDVEVRVAERLASARASDNLKATSLAEVQRKLRIEFEDSYAQRLQRDARDKRELGDKLVQALSRVDVLTSEQKVLINALEVRDGVVRALEHRCASLEKLKHHLKSYRNLVRYMSARVFVNTVRLKRSLHQVHDSLRGLADKLAENAEYDRSSNLILPQHELEQWLRRTEKLVKQPKVAVTPMTAMAATNVNVTVSGGNAGAPTTAQANGTDKATTGKGKGKPGAKPVAAASGVAAGNTANNSVAAVAAATLAGGASAVVPPSVPPSVAQVRSRRATRAAVTYPNLSVSDGSGGGSGDMASFDLFGSSGSSSSRPRGAYTHPLRFGAMLSCLGEVETVLRGCLVECLAKAGEWKGACEDFFLRNQDLLAERDQAREMHKQAQEQVAQLQAALAVLQRGLAAGSGSEEQRKALLIADAAAASVAGNSSTTPNAAVLLSAGESSVGAASTSASLLNAAVGKNGGNASSTGAATAGGAEVKGVQQALSMLEAHAHTARLAATDATRARDVARLSAADLAELSRAPHRASRSSHGQTPAPRGFFDHRDALVQACMMHKLDLEKTKKSNRELRTQNEVLREALRQARLSAQHGLPALMPAGQQQQHQQQHQQHHHQQAEQYNYAQQQQQSYYQQQQEEQKESPVSSSHGDAAAATPSSSSQQHPHQPARPTLSQLDVEDTLPVRNIRPLIPFSPPVHPVSPWTGVSPAAAAAAGASAASTSSRPVSRESVGGARAHLATTNINGRSSVIVPSTPASARTVPSSPYTTLPYRPGTAGGGAPLSSRPATGSKGALAHTQPISTSTTSSVVITTASSSYASTPVYTPLVGTPTPHASNKAAEKVYGGATMHGVLSDMAIPALARPRTSSGVGARVSAALAAQNKALQTASAAGVGVGVITGDLSYDIISPYMAQPLPWERRPATAGSGGYHYNTTAAAATTGQGSPRQHTLAASAARRQKAAQYGRQIKEQHAAQAAAREREESAYRDSAFERPFQSQTGTAATTPHHRHHADGAGSAVPFDLDVPLIPAPVTTAEGTQMQRRANNHSSPSIAPAPAPPSSSSSSSVRGRPGSAARSRVLTSAAGALPSPMAAPVASSAGSSSSASSATSSSSSAAPSRPMSGHSSTLSPRMATKPNNPAAAATTSPPSAFQFNAVAASSSAAPPQQQQQQHSPIIPDYRSIRTGGAVGQRPHVQTGPGMLQQSLQHGSLAAEGQEQEVSYGDTPFDRSPSRSQSRTHHHPAPPQSSSSSSAAHAQPSAGAAAAAVAANGAGGGGGGDDDEYEEDFSS